MRTIDAAQRRARLAARHRLAPEHRGADVATVAGEICGLHATDPATVFLAARARLAAPSVAAIERALYDECSLVRILGMRRTMFVVPVALAAVVQASSTRAIVVAQRKLLVKHVEESGVAADGEAWLRAAMEDTLRALEARGEAKAAELSQDVPALRAKLALAQGKPYAATPAVGSRVLFLLAAEGAIVRGRPLGSWTSTLYRWSPMASWLGGGLADLDYLGAHRERLFDYSGNIGPTVWWDGRIVGGWAQRADGEIALGLLEDAGADAAGAIAAEAQRVRDWIADVRVTPRFRTPLERELVS